jgi:hypothetical protein
VFSKAGGRHGGFGLVSMALWFALGAAVKQY